MTPSPLLSLADPDGASHFTVKELIFPMTRCRAGVAGGVARRRGPAEATRWASLAPEGVSREIAYFGGARVLDFFVLASV